MGTHPTSEYCEETRDERPERRIGMRSFDRSSIALFCYPSCV